MPTVPPGNKQIGDATSIVVVNTVDGTTGINNYAISGFAVTEDTNNTINSQPIHNVQIGDITSIAVVLPDAATNLYAQTLTAFALVHYAPPTVFHNMSTVSLALVESEGDVQIPPLKNVMLGSQSSIVVTTNNPDINTTACNSIQGFVVVQEYQPRKELTVLNIEYTADAQFNQITP